MSVEPLTTGSPVRSPRAPHAPRPVRTTTPPRRRRATRPGATPTRSRLTAVPAPRVSAPRAPFVLLVVALLGLGLLALLLLNTASAQDAFRLSDLQRQSKALADQEQSLTRQAEGLSNPASVAAAAAQLGMVPGAVPIFLAPGQKIPVGEIVGGMVIVPAPRTAPPATPAATPTAKTPAATPPAAKTPTSNAAAGTSGTKPPTAADVQKAMRDFAAFKRYADWVKAHPQTGTATTGSHP